MHAHRQLWYDWRLQSPSSGWCILWVLIDFENSYGGIDYGLLCTINLCRPLLYTHTHTHTHTHARMHACTRTCVHTQWKSELLSINLGHISSLLFPWPLHSHHDANGGGLWQLLGTMEECWSCRCTLISTTSPTTSASQNSNLPQTFWCEWHEQLKKVRCFISRTNTTQV